MTYQATNNATTAPASGTWQTSPVALTASAPYLWSRIIITFSDSTTQTVYMVSTRGSDGSPGAPGTPGAAGKGISSTAITYQVGNSGTTAPTGTWQTSVQATTTTNPYLWTRIVLTYTDSTTATAYSVSRRGDDGTAGGGGGNYLPLTGGRVIGPVVVSQVDTDVPGSFGLVVKGNTNNFGLGDTATVPPAFFEVISDDAQHAGGLAVGNGGTYFTDQATVFPGVPPAPAMGRPEIKNPSFRKGFRIRYDLTAHRLYVEKNVANGADAWTAASWNNAGYFS
jgi:hypothetical protein